MFFLLLKIYHSVVIIIYTAFMCFIFMFFKIRFAFVYLFVFTFIIESRCRKKENVQTSLSEHIAKHIYHQERKRKMMKAYAIGLYEKAMPGTMNWQEKLICARECGYDFVEISIDETDEKLSRLDWSAEQRLELVKAMKDTGIRAPQIPLRCIGPGSTQPKHGHHGESHSARRRPGYPDYSACRLRCLLRTRYQ